MSNPVHSVELGGGEEKRRVLCLQYSSSAPNGTRFYRTGFFCLFVFTWWLNFISFKKVIFYLICRDKSFNIGPDG